MIRKIYRAVAGLMVLLTLTGLLAGCRAEKNSLTAPDFTNPMQLANKTGEAAQEKELATAAYGVMTGSTAEIYVANTYPAAKIGTYINIADAFLALDGGKIDYVITPYTTALNAIRGNPALTIYQKDVISENVAIAVAKGNTKLREQIDTLLTQFKSDGTLERVVMNWTTEGQAYVRENVPVSDGKNGVLRVAVAADREPMCFVEENGYQGLDCELIRRIAYELGMTVEFQNMTFSSLIAALQSGKADVVISNMTPTAERAESVDFTQAYFDNPQVIVARGSSAKSVPEYTQLSQLEGKVLCNMTGSIFDELLKSRIPGVQISYFNTVTDELAALKNGKVEGIPLDEPVAELSVAKNPDLAILPELVMEDHYGVALVKDSPLTVEFNRLIAAMKADGTLDAMHAKWTGADDSKKTLPEVGSGENGTLKVACTVTLEPMCYMGAGGQPTGYDVEIILRIAAALGKRVEFIPVDFSGLIAMLQSGKADAAIGSMSITEERRELVDMTDSYYDGGVYLVVRSVDGESAASGESFWDGLKGSFTRTFITESRWKLVLDGLWVTVLLSVCSGLLGSVLGFGICMLRRSRLRALRAPTAGFIRLIQGTPVVVLLMILYYILFGKVDISAILVAIIGFSVNFGVYVSEMMRTGIDAVDKGQIEAAYALGFTKIRTFRKITFPQAARHFLPVFKGEFISMVKMTSVVGYIAVQDLTKVSDIIRSRTLEAFFPLIATAVIYFLVANLLTILLSRLEIGLDPKRRKRTVKGVVEK